MDLDAILNIISSVGFPIACAIALGIFIWKITITMITNQKEREDKLYDELAECRSVNEKAIATIAQYADSLTTIQQDVGHIKHDITIINTKLDT